MNARKGGDAAAAERAYNEGFVPASKNYEGKVMDLLSLQRKSIDQTAAAIDQANDRGTRLMILLSVLLIAIGVVAAVIISRSITRPLKDAVHAASMVAAGDLTTVIDTSSRDEIGELMQALHAMNEALRKIVSQVKSGTYAIAGASGRNFHR